MSTKVASEVSSFDGQTVEDGRYYRALTEPMEIDALCGGRYAVESSSGIPTSLIPKRECAHARSRPPRSRLICKHPIRTALGALFDDEQRKTELVAHVARTTHEYGCEYEIKGYVGPTATGEPAGGHPCLTCVKSVGGDDWAVWSALHNGSGQ